MRRKLLYWLAATLAGLAGIVSFLTVWPVSLGLGPCMRDWTSPSSWQPRASPLASLTVPVGDGAVRLCYGRPSTRSRQVFGGLVPWGRIWRLGANEPTRLFTAIPLEVAGVPVPAGRWSLYAVPTDSIWEIGVNASTFRWGNDFSPGVMAREVGRGRVVMESIARPVDTLTFHPERAGGDTTYLVMTWARSTIRIPLVPGQAP